MPSIVKECQSVKDYRFPFEGEKHLATAVILPYRADTWRDGAKPALEEYLAVVQAVSAFEPVIVIADPRLPYETVARFELPAVTILRLPTDDSWARDTLPVFLARKEDLVGVDFGFNSWGGDYNGLYHPWDRDNRLGREFLEELMIPRFAKKDFILEGGSIHTDGEGTLLTTSCCLLSPGRNPLLSQEQIEKTLKETLNQEKVIFLPKGIVDDETSGHVDNIACFLAPGTVLLATSDDPSDPQYRDSREDAEVLAEETDAKGRKLTVIPLPVPKPLYLTEEESAGIADSGNAIERKAGRRLAASYVNFYLGEKFALVPQFGVPEDEKAVKVLGDFYQGTKKIIPIRSREILLGGGNIHCITKQIPYSEKIAKENEEKEA